MTNNPKFSKKNRPRDFQVMADLDSLAVVGRLKEHQGVLLSTSMCSAMACADPSKFYAPGVLELDPETWSKHMKVALKDSLVTIIPTSKNEYNGGKWFYVGPAPLILVYKNKTDFANRTSSDIDLFKTLKNSPSTKQVSQRQGSSSSNTLFSVRWVGLDPSTIRYGTVGNRFRVCATAAAPWWPLSGRWFGFVISDKVRVRPIRYSRCVGLG